MYFIKDNKLKFTYCNSLWYFVNIIYKRPLKMYFLPGAETETESIWWSLLSANSSDVCSAQQFGTFCWTQEEQTESSQRKNEVKKSVGRRLVVNESELWRTWNTGWYSARPSGCCACCSFCCPASRRLMSYILPAGRRSRSLVPCGSPDLRLKVQAAHGGRRWKRKGWWCWIAVLLWCLTKSWN